MIYLEIDDIFSFLPPLSNLFSSTLTLFSPGLIFCLMNFHCSLLVGSLWKKLVQKALCACLNLLLTKFLKRLISLYVSLSGLFFHLLDKKCFWAIKFFNSCVNQGLKFLNFCNPYHLKQILHRADAPT